VSYGEVLVDKSVTDLVLRVLDYTYIVTISFGKLFCNVWVCGCVYVCVMCAFWQYVY